MENQVEMNMESEMETGIIPWFIVTRASTNKSGAPPTRRILRYMGLKEDRDVVESLKTS